MSSQSELHNPTIASRYSLLAEAYLRGCGAHRQELVKQTKVLNQLAKVAMRVKEAPSADKKKVRRRHQLVRACVAKLLQYKTERPLR